MVVVLKHGISDDQKKSVRAYLQTNGYTVKEIQGEVDTILGAVGVSRLDLRSVEMQPGVERVIPITKPYKFASREFKSENTIIKVGPVKIGGDRIVVIAGPCAIESREQIMETAARVRESGAVILRGGAFKPRTSPYAFQGLGEEGLIYMKEAGEKFGMPIVSEIVSTESADMMNEYVDIFQIGARNMQNFELLKKVGRFGKAVILKRGLCATIEEWLMAAEYLIAHGTDDIILCERGIRTYETATRNTLDLSAIPVVRKLSHLPIIVDPSHATGRRDSVIPMGLAGVAAGADGLIVEVHPDPDKAVSDGPQSLLPAQFEKMMRDVEAMAPVIGKEVERLSVLELNSVPGTIYHKKDGESRIEVGFQGEPGAYSEVALYKYFDKDQFKSKPYKEFNLVFDAVLKGEIQYGVLPIENSLAGSVHSNYDWLLQYPDITIVGELRIRIEHNLIGFGGITPDKIKKVYSHPQALSQCSAYLDSLKDVERVPFFDTSGAVRYISEKGEKDSAAIAGEWAAGLWGMEILKKGIETNPRNYTRFFVVTKGTSEMKSDSDKASVVFGINDKAGSLFNVLRVFNDSGLNLKKLESRPILGQPWEYMFYLDIEIGSNREKLEQIFKELKETTDQFRVLGFYRGMPV